VILHRKRHVKPTQEILYTGLMKAKILQRLLLLLTLLVTGCTTSRASTQEQPWLIPEGIDPAAPEAVRGAGGCPVDIDAFLDQRAALPRTSYEELALMADAARLAAGSSPFPTQNIALQQTSPPGFDITDGSFVWGPDIQDFNILAALEQIDSPLAAYAEHLDLWASYTTVNPTILLAFLEMQHGYVSSLPQDIHPEEVINTIGITAMDLAEAFYEHLYIWGSRKSQSPPVPPAVQTTDGVGVQLGRDLSSGTFAVIAAAARQNGYNEWTSRVEFPETEPETDTASFTDIYGSLFPQGGLEDGTTDINPPAAPPADMFQLAYPLGATWYVSGAHSWAGGSTPPPLSSLDFYLRPGIPCADPPDHYTVAAAYGQAIHPSDYSCWIQMDHGGGWVTSYYHLLQPYSGGAMGQNGSLGSISCEICAGGFSTGPHVHFSLKYNGAYISLEGVSLSGWIVHPDSGYFSGTLERDGVILEAYSRVFNDYDLYFPREELSLRFYGNGTGNIDRVKVRLNNPPRPADIGSQDFTIEWWMKALPEENSSPACTTGADAWAAGSVLFDRRMQGAIANGTYGISIMNGAIAFGARNSSSGSTLCGAAPVLDGEWHHIAVTRTTAGAMRIFVDGVLDASGTGPSGDISYADGRTAVHFDDPFLVIGAERFDTGLSYSGWLDEIRLSNTIRYTGTFTVPDGPFATDSSTVGLYHFNEGERNTNWDTSGYESGPSNASRRYGGDPAGPAWSTSNPFESVFGDVPDDHWAVDYIEALYDAGYIAGCSAQPRLYCPGNTMIRGESAVFVLRGVEGGEYNPAEIPSQDQVSFADVDYQFWYAPWAQALYEGRYTAGCGEDPLIFCPENGHIRAEAAVFFLRMMHGPDYQPPVLDETDELAFSDLAHDAWYTDWIEAAYTAGIYLPCQPEPTLMACPEDPLMRDMAAFMMVQARGGLPLE
jgi:murein DD-endopeptidase MepM/ murein hydrolase activator NlpD